MTEARIGQHYLFYFTGNIRIICRYLGSTGLIPGPKPAELSGYRPDSNVRHRRHPDLHRNCNQARVKIGPLVFLWLGAV
jgi:hypothetical protein